MEGTHLWLKMYRGLDDYVLEAERVVALALEPLATAAPAQPETP